MQILQVVRTSTGYELYCEMCNSTFLEDFVKNHIKEFAEAHRHIHTRSGLDTPDLPDNLDGKIHDYIEISRDVDYRIEQLSTGLPTVITLVSPSKMNIYPQK